MDTKWQKRRWIQMEYLVYIWEALFRQALDECDKIIGCFCLCGIYSQTLNPWIIVVVPGLKAGLLIDLSKFLET